MQGLVAVDLVARLQLGVGQLLLQAQVEADGLPQGLRVLVTLLQSLLLGSGQTREKEN